MHTRSALIALLFPALLAGQQPKTIRVQGAWPAMRLVPVATIDDATLDVTEVKGIAVSAAGTVVVRDKGAQLLVFRAPAMKRELLGRKGSGPGEYQELTSIGWMHDTLVLNDTRLRRLSFYRERDFQFLKSFPLVYKMGYAPWDISTNAAAAYAFSSRSLDTRGPATGPRPQILPEMQAYRVTPAGFGPAVQGLVDTSAGASGFDCEEGDGQSIQIFDAFFPDHGAHRTVSSRGELIFSHPDSFALMVRGGGSSRNDRIIDPSFPLAPISNALWDSVSEEYRTTKAKAKTGFKGCSSSPERPQHIPAIRGIAIDEQDRLWVEVTEPGGDMIRILSLDGKPVGRVALPTRDTSIPWVASNNKLYLVTKNPDGLQSIRIFEVKR